MTERPSLCDSVTGIDTECGQKREEAEIFLFTVVKYFYFIVVFDGDKFAVSILTLDHTKLLSVGLYLVYRVLEVELAFKIRLSCLKRSDLGVELSYLSGSIANHYRATNDKRH